MRRALLTLVLLAACADGAAPEEPSGAGGAPAELPEGEGVDRAAVEACLVCHEAVRPAWEGGSSHALLGGCVECHELRAIEPGPGHTRPPDCAPCHAERIHPLTATCMTCHAAHGPEGGNLFLLRQFVPLPGGREAEIVATTELGAGEFGLVRAGATDLADGLCEVCHTRTLHWRADGRNTPHDGTRCRDCHAHWRGFQR